MSLLEAAGYFGLSVIGVAVYERVAAYLRRKVTAKRLVSYAYPDLSIVEWKAIRAAAVHHKCIPLEPDEHRPALSWWHLNQRCQDRAVQDMAETIKVYNQTKITELGKLASLEVTSK